jgi:CHAD domain-containing protein
MNDGNDELRLYVRVKGRVAQQFKAIKEHLGLKNDTEVMRYLIADFYSQKLEKKHQSMPPLTCNDV